MAKKAFIGILSIIGATFLATTLVSHCRAPMGLRADFDRIPLGKGEWVGSREEVPQPIVEMLSPDAILSASFVSKKGDKVHLFVDYYSPQNTVGAIHSPRNCLPGSGWIIAGSGPRLLEFSGRKIHAGRFKLTLGKANQIMDFWYITRFGETASDYRLKFNTMISSLVLKPTDKAFVRFVASDDPGSIAAMEEFEKLFTDEIYKALPF
jgi:EpsI family protein